MSQLIVTTVPTDFDMTSQDLRQLAYNQVEQAKIIQQHKTQEFFLRRLQRNEYLRKYTTLWMQEMITLARNKMYAHALTGKTSPLNMCTPWHLGSKYLDSKFNVSTIVHQYKMTDKTSFYEIGFTDQEMPFQKVTKVLKEQNGIILEDISTSSKGLMLWVRLSLM